MVIASKLIELLRKQINIILYGPPVIILFRANGKRLRFADF